MELRHSPYQRKKGSKKVKAPLATCTSFNAQARNETLDWTSDEDALLRDGVCQFGGKNWKAIAGRIEHRSPAECSKRWNTLQGLDTVVKRPWSEEEDMEMRLLVEKYGASKWSVIASYLKDRNGKQCRERWHNQLNPSIKKTPWTDEENETILRLQAQYGNCWAKITAALPGRTDNSVKNHWHSSLKSLGKSRGSDSSSSRDLAKTKRCKVKRKSRRAKGAKKEKASLVSQADDDALAFIDNFVAQDQGSACTVDDIAMVAAQAVASDSISLSSLPIAPIDCFNSPDAGCGLSPAVKGGRGSFSPDSVSSMDTFDLYLQSYTSSYREDVLKAQAVIDNILDPMGIGGCNLNRINPPCPGNSNSFGDEAIFNHDFQRSLATWYASDDHLCRSASTNLLTDPTSPAQPPVGLDELLFDPLQDVCAQMQPNPSSNDVALTFQQPIDESKRPTCDLYLSPSAISTDPTRTCLPAPDMPLLDQMNDALFLKEDAYIDAIHYEVPTLESSFGQDSSSIVELPALFEMDL